MKGTAHAKCNPHASPRRRAMRRAHISPALAIGLDLCDNQSVANTASLQTAKGAHMTDLNTMTREQLLALVTTMQSNPRKLTMKVSDKGALSVYGLGRFPVTLYRGQWERLLGAQVEITAFIEANATTLTVKV
jgi:hypothetical protein